MPVSRQKYRNKFWNSIQLKVAKKLIQATLSKSLYNKGLQCPKALWFSRNRRDLKPETDSTKQARFQAGLEVGRVAQKYFGDGVEVIADYWDVAEAEKLTREFVAKGHEVIYEATAIHSESGGHCRIDILHKVEGTNEWDLIEVKSAARVKEAHVSDMSYQFYVFQGAGYRIRKCFMMVIDNRYVRNGDIDARGLFKLQEITELVTAKQGEVKIAFDRLVQVLKLDEEPQVEIGVRCKSPYTCDYLTHCWKNVPEYSVFNIFAADRAEEIARHIDSYDINEVPADLLPDDKKLIDITSFCESKMYVDKEKIKSFIEQFEYPLYYLDYETLGPAIPLYQGTSPFTAIPFQFSLHIQSEPGGAVQHHEFLHKEHNDPRRAFVETLIGDCGTKGSVVVYHQAFERGRNNELVKAFPEYSNELRQINNRMVDLLIPFRNRWLYHPRQNGSVSLKSVLPAFTELDYQDMGIAGGADASIQYEAYAKGNLSNDEAEALWDELSEYCKLDTQAMVSLVAVLKKLVAEVAAD